MDETIRKIKDINDEKSKSLLDKAKHDDLVLTGIQTQEVIVRVASALVSYLDNKVAKTEITNQLTDIGTPDALEVQKAIDSLHETLKGQKEVDLSGLTEVMGNILTVAKELPKKFPEPKEAKDYTQQFKSLVDAVKAVEKVVKAQKLIAEAPIINVPETEVTVEPPDLKPLQKNIGEVVKAVNKIVIPQLDTKNVEKIIKESNKLLKQIIKKPVSRGGGGGGGSSWNAVNTAGIPLPLRLLDSTATPGVNGLVVINPDGTNIGGGGVNPTPSGAAAQALTNDTSAAYEASSVSKAGAGTVYGLTGYNSRTSDQFFQFFNSTTVPADATAPVITIRVAASSNFSVDFGVYGRRFSTGISWSNSSTGATKTIGSADMFVDINYV